MTEKELEQRNKARMREFDELVAKRQAEANKKRGAASRKDSGPVFVSEEHAALYRLGQQGRL